MTNRTSGVFDLNRVELSSTVTVANYREMERGQNREGLANFVQERLSERYIAPLRSVPSEKKHGFLIMAASCLLVETLESFYRGWGSTDTGINRVDIQDPCKPADPNRTTVSSSEVAFCYFFQRESAFVLFRPSARDFYVHVRCGILHQGETTGGWRIWRDGDLFHAADQTINADKFLAGVERALQSYTGNLRSARWDEDIWKNFRSKMDAIIEHCKR